MSNVPDLMFLLIWGCGIADIISFLMTMMKLMRLASFFAIAGTCFALVFVVMAVVWGSLFITGVGVLIAYTVIAFCLLPALDDLLEKSQIEKSQGLCVR